MQTPNTRSATAPETTAMSKHSMVNAVESIERLFLRSRQGANIIPQGDLFTFFTPFDEAVEIAKERRQNPALMAAVEHFLQGDIPEVFTGPEPIFYLSRHVATPNYETLRYIAMTKDHAFPTVIGQDPLDKFVSNNILKRALGKLSVTKATSRNGDEIVEHFTVLDFAKVQGKRFCDITTVGGDNLVGFHNELLRQIYPNDVVLSDESAWINRQHRGKLYEHYVQYLSLLVAHGIMIEDYVPEDYEFITEVLMPAMDTVTKMFGHKPLICPRSPTHAALERNWVGYPSALYPFVKAQFAKPA